MHLKHTLVAQELLQSLANSIPQGTYQVVVTGNISKVSHAAAAALCKRNIKARGHNDELTSKIIISSAQNTGRCS